MWKALPGDLETSAETAPPLSNSGISDCVLLLTEGGAEDFNSELLLFKEQSVPNYLVSSLQYIPFYRTSEVFISPHSLIASNISTETEESFDDSQVNAKQDENLNNSALSTGYFPYYRSYEEPLGKPLAYNLNVNAEGKQPGTNRKDRRQGRCAQAVRNVEKTVPPSLEPDKRVVSSNAEPSAHPLLLESISENCASKTAFLNELPSLGLVEVCSWERLTTDDKSEMIVAAHKGDGQQEK
nr:PREDICTED: uncharacterized protein LOC104141062 isoform X2 [Struthio camelus australis]